MARPRKISEDELKEIIKRYTEETPYITTIKYSNLAKYAREEMGYKDATYQDFSRNKTMQQIVNVYNEQKKLSDYIRKNNDKIVKLDFNVDSLVDKYKNNSKQLKVILRAYKDVYDRSFEELKKYAESDKENRERIKKQEEIISDLEKKNKELRHEIRTHKEKNKDGYKANKMKWMYILLQDMIKQNNCYIETEEEIIDILKNFGYESNDTLDVEDVIESESEFELKNNNQIHEKTKYKIEKETIVKETSVTAECESNVISIDKNNTKLKLPDFMKNKN